VAGKLTQACSFPPTLTCNPVSVSRWSGTTAAIGMSAVSDPNGKPKPSLPPRPFASAQILNEPLTLINPSVAVQRRDSLFQM
jgi:hypothetical protein